LPKPLFPEALQLEQTIYLLCRTPFYPMTAILPDNAILPDDAILPDYRKEGAAGQSGFHRLCPAAPPVSS